MLLYVDLLDQIIEGKIPAPAPLPEPVLPDDEGLFEDDLFIDPRKPPEATGVIPL